MAGIVGLHFDLCGKILLVVTRLEVGLSRGGRLEREPG